MPPKKQTQEVKILLGRPKGNLKMGLVGLPNVGKSTTFNLLCKQAVPAENFPFCTIEPHEARMNVPDERFRTLCRYFKPKSEVPATLTIFDIAGLVPGAHKGEGLGNAFLSNIQAVDGIYHVVRAFEGDEIVHTEGEVNPVKDIETISNELRMKDLERVEKLIVELVRITKDGTDRTKKEQCNSLQILKNVLTYLKAGNWISNKSDWKFNEIEVLNEHQFLTAKPVVYLVNLSEKDYIRQRNKFLPKIAEWVKNNIDGCIIPYSAEFESKLVEFTTDEEKTQYMKDVGASKSMIDKIINTGYSALNLLHYFTAGEDEVKCWTIRNGTKAPQAAGIIHSDFERGFICAEVYKYNDLIELGSEAAIKAAGKYMQKGKDYIVEDGDIIFFKFNVTNTSKK
ncbi:GTP-binding protein [Cryptosporidium andersoni]|uniref:Obg-like ATPase 1 n=1 Tax=Cryptosporidium andersoni TaxID=117008 RepID=A0A1J4MCI0_9CRYT|nr:GTP-binding protein [Cryptosporidium andersoni]